MRDLGPGHRLAHYFLILRTFRPKTSVLLSKNSPISSTQLSGFSQLLRPPGAESGDVMRASGGNLHHSQKRNFSFTGISSGKWAAPSIAVLTGLFPTGAPHLIRLKGEEHDGLPDRTPAAMSSVGLQAEKKEKKEETVRLSITGKVQQKPLASQDHTHSHSRHFREQLCAQSLYNPHKKNAESTMG